MDGKTVIPVEEVPEAIIEFAGIIGKTKNLKYPEITRTIRTNQIGIKNQRATSSAIYNILGVKICSGRASHTNLVNSVYITKENGKSIVRLNVAR